MKAFRYITAACAIVAMAACTDDLDVGGFATDPNAVRIRATVGEPLARTNPAGDATTVTQFNKNDKMTVSTLNQEAAVYTFDGTDWSPATPDKYLTWDSDKQQFTAYYPDTYNGSGNVPADQSTLELIAAADYMKFEGELPMQKTVSFTMKRQTARVIINDLRWGDEYKDNSTNPATITHQLTSFSIHCNGVADMTPYKQVQDGNTRYYVLVNAQAAQSEAPFLTLTIAPKQEGGTPITHTVKGIPAFQPGYSYTYNVTIGKNGVTLSDIVVDDWSTGSILPGEGSAEDDMKTHFSVTAPNGNFTYAGGTKDYTVNSYVVTGEGAAVALPWTAAFVRKLNDGTYEEIKQGEADYPTWITGFPDKDRGKEAKQVCPITVAQADISNPHYTTLKNNASVSGTYNLANATGGEAVENTANCYIVNAAGTYSFPLVYGNAIKGSADNKSAYTSTATGNLALEQFLNHKDEPITSPYIAAHSGCEPANAVLVWQDADQLISNIQFVDGGSPEAHRITFDVAQATIKQGNAIIAIRDVENTILWSWHIWVTDYEPLQAATVTATYNSTEMQRDKKVWSFDNKSSYTFMGVPLGWCDAESAAGREALVLLTQTETGQTQELTIKQDPLAAGSNCTFYQWGRKDPMLPSNGLGNNDKPYYGEYAFTKTLGQVITLGRAIQSPHEVYDRGKEGWVEWYSAQSTVAGKDFFQNLWDANNSSTGDRYNIGVKTVYDPSPVGYIVPPSSAISGFTFDGESAGREDETSDWDKSYTDKFNSVEKTRAEVDAIKGMTFYCKGMNKELNTYNKDGGVIYFPAVGTRDQYYGCKLDRVGVRGAFWTTASTEPSSGEIRALLIDFDLIYVLTKGKVYSSISLPVRPIREQ